MTDILQHYLLPLLHKIDRPVPWGSFHSAFFFIGIPLAVLIAYLLRGLTQKAEKRMLLSVGVFLLLYEIFKQLAYTAIEGAFRYDLIPFQLCSIPMYLCILIALLPEGRLSLAARTFICTFGLMGGVASYISPETMCREYLELTLHSFIWHLILIFLGFYVFFSHNTHFKKTGFVGAQALYLILCAVAFSINLLLSGTPGIAVNMFYIGPKPSTLPICREITAQLGVAVNSIIYVSALSLCAFLIHLTEYYLQKITKR
jgi:uncharacterized membrane protein YwaF